jgi:uncharacterized protein YbjT (DUF2867 family)
VSSPSEPRESKAQLKSQPFPAGHNVAAVSRNPKSIEINGREVETAAANFINSAALHKVLQKADRVFVNLPSTSFSPAEPLIAATKAIGEAAKTNGVHLIVFNSSMPIPDTPQGIKAQDDRREIRSVL